MIGKELENANKENIDFTTKKEVGPIDEEEICIAYLVEIIK
ncbi:5783_t:CDS:1, partial [Gigaspora margarita]